MEAIKKAHIDYLDAEIDKLSEPGAYDKAIAANKEGSANAPFDNAEVGPLITPHCAHNICYDCNTHNRPR
ncbi:hypothetical protein V1288_000488 [Bradyrhizobium sp. AZCC 2176]